MFADSPLAVFRYKRNLMHSVRTVRKWVLVNVTRRANIRPRAFLPFAPPPPPPHFYSSGPEVFEYLSIRPDVGSLHLSSELLRCQSASLHTRRCIADSESSLIIRGAMSDDERAGVEPA